MSAVTYELLHARACSNSVNIGIFVNIYFIVTLWSYVLQGCGVSILQTDCIIRISYIRTFIQYSDFGARAAPLAPRHYAASFSG